MMRGLYAIYRKEIGHFFVSPIAYAVVGLFLFISGFFFNLYVQSALQESMQEMQGMGAPAFDAASQVLRVFLGLVAL
jgi:ABC-2 type transport system permease protein